MKRFKLVTAFLLFALFAGGIVFFYQAFWNPQRLLEKNQRTQRRESPLVIPDQGNGSLAFKETMNMSRSEDVEKARKSLLDFLIAYPQFPKIFDVKRALGDLNVNELFSASSSSDKVLYTVIARDSLSRIASRFQTSADLIFQVNHLDSTSLQIGQQLVVPQLEISVLIDRKNRTLTLLNHGQFFKEYPIVSMQMNGRDGAFQTKVIDKLAIQQNGKRVALESKSYASCARSIILARTGLVLRSVAPEGVATPRGIVVSDYDIKEMFALINRGTTVTIR